MDNCTLNHIIIRWNENFFFSRVLFGIVVIENLFLVLVVVCYYYILAYIMQIQTTFLYISYFILNTTSLFFTIEYITFVYSTRSRIHFINDILKQLLFNVHDSDKIVKNITTPTISYNEIYNIYDREINEKSSKNYQTSTSKPAAKKSQNRFIRMIIKGDTMYVKKFKS